MSADLNAEYVWRSEPASGRRTCIRCGAHTAIYWSSFGYEMLCTGCAAQSDPLMLNPMCGAGFRLCDDTIPHGTGECYGANAFAAAVAKYSNGEADAQR